MMPDSLLQNLDRLEDLRGLFSIRMSHIWVPIATLAPLLWQN
jgi:hypothetical protein